MARQGAPREGLAAACPHHRTGAHRRARSRAGRLGPRQSPERRNRMTVPAREVERINREYAFSTTIRDAVMAKYEAAFADIAEPSDDAPSGATESPAAAKSGTESQSAGSEPAADPNAY